MRFITPLLRGLLLLCLSGTAFAAPADSTPELIRHHTGKLTYVDFWASWCGPCAESFPWLNEMQAKYGSKGLHIVGVGLDTDNRKADRFLKAHPPQFDIVRDAGGSVAEHYAVEGMPYSVLLDADGRVIHRHTGFRANDTADYEQAIQNALANKGSNP